MNPPILTALLLGLGLLSNGAAHAQVCTREYAPVCGQVAGQTAPQTFANRCLLNAAQARLLSTGPCPSTAADTRPMTGNDADAHGCKAYTGHTWNPELARCVRPWTSNVNSTRKTTPGVR